jgi:perosamine synthetase
MLARALPYIDLHKTVEFIQCHFNESRIYANVSDFENRFSKILNVPKCYATDSGSVALFFALKSVDIQPGDEILVQSFICNTVIDEIIRLGAIPVLVDSTLDDYNISILDLKAKLTKKTKVILVAHLFGKPAEINEVKQIAALHSCFLIEDCAHTFLCKTDNRMIGSFGDLSIFSFNFDKPMTTGKGGMLVVNNPILFQRVETMINESTRSSMEEEQIYLWALLLQFYLMQPSNYKKFLSFNYTYFILKARPYLIEKINKQLFKNGNGFYNEIIPMLSCHKINSRYYYLKGKIKNKENKHKSNLMNNWRGAFGNLQLDQFDLVSKIRNQNARYFMDHINNTSLMIPYKDSGDIVNFLRFTLLFNSRCVVQRIIKNLKYKGYEVGNFTWPYPIHLLRRYQKNIVYDKTTLKNCEYIAQNMMQLPIHYYVDESSKEMIINIINSF